MIPETLITTQPLWVRSPMSDVLAYGPFMVVRGGVKILGMFLRQDSEDCFSYFDGNRTRYWDYVSIESNDKQITVTDGDYSGVIRPLALADAKFVGLDPNRANLSKEDVVSKVLLAFQQSI